MGLAWAPDARVISLSHPPTRPPTQPPSLHPRFLDEQGYYISQFGFRGPFLNSQDIRAGRPITLDSVNLYCVKKTLQDAMKSSKDPAPQYAWRRRRRALLGAAAAAEGQLLAVGRRSGGGWEGRLDGGQAEGGATAVWGERG